MAGITSAGGNPQAIWSQMPVALLPSCSRCRGWAATHPACFSPVHHARCERQGYRPGA